MHEKRGRGIEELYGISLSDLKKYQFSRSLQKLNNLAVIGFSVRVFYKSHKI